MPLPRPIARGGVLLPGAQREWVRWQTWPVRGLWL